ncbi:MAG: hypothetical protein GX417_01015 [Clostridiales bacterium]|nr:hypothetical protein [Clostridiales bacterium]
MNCLIHKWDGCKCKRCGKVRDEQHDWEGCKCKRCGKTRDEGHDWDLCKGKCKRCGKACDEQHDWDGCKCKRCGKVRDEQHDWDGCQCTRCGKTRKLPPVIKENLSACMAGDHIVFGKWKGAPLYWTVLDAQGDKLLLITDECLETKPFHLSGAAAWDTCSLREELNGEYFYTNHDVFSEKERQAILETTNDSPGIYYQNVRNWEELYTNPGNDTQDYVFLLNVVEACKYFNVTGKGEMRDSMGYKAFEFPQSERLSAEFPWWLRNSTRKGAAAVVVTTHGMINYNGFTVSERHTPQVRPALWIRK